MNAKQPAIPGGMTPSIADNNTITANNAKYFGGRLNILKPLYSSMIYNLATPDLRAASATAFETAGPTLGSNAAGIM